MKTIIALTTLPLVLVLGGCSQGAEESVPAEDAAVAVEIAPDVAAPEITVPEVGAPHEASATADDDNDAPEPVAAPAAKEEPHDESVPHDH